MIQPVFMRGLSLTCKGMKAFLNRLYNLSRSVLLQVMTRSPFYRQGRTEFGPAATGPPISLEVWWIPSLVCRPPLPRIDPGQITSIVIPPMDQTLLPHQGWYNAQSPNTIGGTYSSQNILTLDAYDPPLSYTIPILPNPPPSPWYPPYVPRHPSVSRTSNYSPSPPLTPSWKIMHWPVGCHLLIWPIFLCSDWVSTHSTVPSLSVPPGAPWYSQSTPWILHHWSTRFVSHLYEPHESPLIEEIFWSHMQLFPGRPCGSLPSWCELIYPSLFCCGSPICTSGSRSEN